MSPSLLSLPQELRDSIIQLVLTAGTAPSKVVEKSGRSEDHQLEYISRIQGRGIFYPDEKCHTTPFALLLVNHQIHDETKEAISRISSLPNGTRYELDVILEDEERLYPTWTYIPPLAQNVDALLVTFRIFGIGTNETNGFMDAGGSTGSAVWRLYSILERFMRCGASAARFPTENRGLELNLLDINVETPTFCDQTLLAPDDVGPDNLPKFRTENAPHNQAMHPATLAKFIYVWVEGILRLSDPSYALPGTPIAKYSKLFFDKIKKVGISVDGEQRFAIDVEEMAREIAERSDWWYT